MTDQQPPEVRSPGAAVKLWYGRITAHLAARPAVVAVWLSGAALIVSVIALVVAVNAGGGGAPSPGAHGPVGPTITIDPPDGTPAPVGAPASGGSPGSPATPSAAPDRAGVSGVDGVPGAVECPPATITVSDALSLTAALAGAQPGTSIRMTDGSYAGRFVASTPGTSDRPIVLCGGPGAVVDAGSVTGGYAVHLDGASHWKLLGFTVRNGQKGVMADRVQHVEIRGLTVEQIGDEGIHLRNFSSDNLVQDNVVRRTGLRRDKFGEGIYIGTAESNWCTVTGCKPDNSDRNTVRGNRISETTAECVDIKEGTAGGTLVGNTFDGSRLSGSHSDSWVDVKGNGWTVRDNVGRRALQDGFQTHQVVDGWGRDNIFTGNTAEVDGPGYGFNFAPAENNKVTCDNKVTGARMGFANIACG